MENEIKVGEYGRTNLGNIIKFAWFQNSETGETYKNKVILVDKMTTETYPFYYFKKDEYIVKHSPNLIDILEIGDFVNGKEIRCFRSSMCNYDIGLQYNDDYGEYFGINEEDIDTIVTKEQMESISYKVRE